eukprot:CAMPEP_0185755110 /NCGR_PEP_ID=MMETSP1174-20130828/13646_1 /TAXON_ID=35687 /ORGANISM="Dictyocha speculum, Strain CCMP1381" /LENGTH=55 /DNA_ID=CAMNT_0028433543 /DNA_START=334 /DNA_END=501 /DNA_ORIENTATION=-
MRLPSGTGFATNGILGNERVLESSTSVVAKKKPAASAVNDEYESFMMEMKGLGAF